MKCSRSPSGRDRSRRRGDLIHVISGVCELKLLTFLQSRIRRRPANLAEGLLTMTEQRMTYWAAEAEVDEDLEDVDLNLAIGSFGQTGLYEDGVSKNSKPYTGRC